MQSVGSSSGEEPDEQTNQKMKTKYWTACISRVQNKVIITHTGNPYTNLRDAKKAKHRLHSSNAAVVKAGEDEMPTTEVVG